MTDKQNPPEPKNIELTEIVRGNHAWNTCDGGVRGLIFSAEKVKELVEKKHKKNYWKIGALVGGGIAAIASIIGYSFLKTPQSTITQQETLSREEALERFAPRIEYYGAYEEYVPDFPINIDDAGHEIFIGYFIDVVKKRLDTFCSSSGVWDLKLHCSMLYCDEDKNKSGESCDKKEMMGFRYNEIIDVKGVIINDELAYVEISTIESNIDKVLPAFHAESEVEKLYNDILNTISFDWISFPTHGTFKLKQHKSKKHYDNYYGSHIFKEQLDDRVLEPIVEIDGVNVTIEGVRMNGSETHNFREVMEDSNFSGVRYQLSLYEDLLKAFTVIPFPQEEKEFVLFEWDYSVVKRKIKPDTSKNTPEESILLVYELVDSIRTLIER